MDFRLKDISWEFSAANTRGFNPCSNGLSAQSGVPVSSGKVQVQVSILVLMDFRLKGRHSKRFSVPEACFNPCSNGLSAQRTN